MERGHDDRVRTNLLITSTLCMVRRPAEGELASSQQAPGSAHDGREVKSWIGWNRLGETAGQECGFSGVPCRGNGSFLLSPQLETGSREDRTTQRGRSPPTFFRATNWRAVLAAALWTVEGYRTSDEAMVC